MKITNKFGMPKPFVDFARNDKYSKGKADISVTTLIDSPRIRVLKEQHHDKIEVDAVDMIWSLFGTAVHSVLENAEETENDITEERLYSEIDGWVLSGAVDRQEMSNNQINIIDYKVTSVWSVIYGKPEWENQLNCYAYLVDDKNAFKESNVTSLKICAILRDWNRRDSERKENYPKAPIVFVDIPLWSFEDRLKYIKERMTLHQEAQIMFDVYGNINSCVDKDMWKKEDTWAVKKKGQKRAIRVLDSYQEAVDYVKWHSETDKAYVPKKKETYEIELRVGEYTRCGNYCSVADFCNQYKERLK